MRTRLFKAGAMAAGFLLNAAGLIAQGSPPMNTNDPVVVGARVLELNFGLAHTRSVDGVDTEFPILDMNYGLNPSMQVSYVLAWLDSSPLGGPRASGLTNSTLGLKWRVRDGGSDGSSWGVHPQVEVNNPGSSAKRKGLAGGGALILPVQWQRGFQGWTVTTDLGRVVQFRQPNEWFFGASIGRDFGPALALGVELFAESTNHFNRSALLANFGGSVKISERYSLLFSAGRELHRHDAAPATFVGYIGWQVHL